MIQPDEKLPQDREYVFDGSILHKLKYLGMRYSPDPNVALHPELELGFTFEHDRAEFGSAYLASVQVNFTGFQCLEVQPKIIEALNVVRLQETPVVTHAMLGVGHLSLGVECFGLARHERLCRGCTAVIHEEALVEIGLFMDKLARSQFGMPAEQPLAVQLEKNIIAAQPTGISLQFMLAMAVPEAIWKERLQLRRQEVCAAEAFQALRNMKSPPKGELQ